MLQEDKTSRIHKRDFEVNKQAPPIGEKVGRKETMTRQETIQEVWNMWKQGLLTYTEAQAQEEAVNDIYRHYGRKASNDNSKQG